MRCISKIVSGAAATTLLLAATAPSFAQGDPSENEDASRFGDETRSWVELQVSGEAAEGPPSGFSAEIADRVWKRYRESFENEIPESFARESFSEGGSN